MDVFVYKVHVIILKAEKYSTKSVIKADVKTFKTFKTFHVSEN